MADRHTFEGSNALKSCHYDEDNQILEIEFNGGSVHKFSDVPTSIHEGLKEAKSAGAYYHLNIRDKYPSEKQ